MLREISIFSRNRYMTKLRMEPARLYNFIFAFLVFYVFIFATSVKAENIVTPLVTYAKVDKVEATIGDSITYQITIEHAKGVKLQIPDIKKYLSDFTVTSENKIKSKDVDNREVEEIDYKIQAQDVGSYIIKPVEIKYLIPKELEKSFGKSGVAKTSKIYIEIKSVLKPDDKKNKDIEDIKPIEKINVLNVNLLIIIIIGLIILGIAVYLLRKKFVRPEKILLPHELAYKELKELEGEKLIDKGRAKEFYFKISEITRRYLKNRFAISALEKPSQELEKDIAKNEEINSEQQLFLKDFLETTDFYKFTDMAPRENKADEIFEQVFSFVNDTKKLPEPEKKN